MRRPRRLSLRARMLVLLVGVSTILLLVMGAISTYVLSRRVDAQTTTADRHLAALAGALALDPGLAQGHLTGYAAVEIPVQNPLAVVSLTQGKLTDELAAAIRQELSQSGLTAQVRPLIAAGEPEQVRALLIGRGCTQFPALGGCRPADVSTDLRVAGRWARAVPARPGGFAILFVGQPLTAAPDQVRGFIIAELITGAALIVLLSLGGEWLIGRGLVPLDQMTRTANEITSRGDLTARMPDAEDQTEIGRLGSSINLMLDRIQHAFRSRLRSEQKVREFAADASHELRTPLTTIRGYAELYRQGALGPGQLPSAMRRIEQEAERMSTLVAELLELARLDRTSSLDLAEADLASLVRDAVADAIAVEPPRPARAEAPPRLVALVDEARVRQVLANLLANVRAHTPVTTPVAVRLGEISGGVLIEVADAGPGMSAADAARAFDRFHRAAGRPAARADDPGPDDPGPDTAGAGSAGEGDPAGGGRSSGSGLGLAIVQAIADAHGGRATLESWPGQGTRVRVWLPVKVVSPG